ncbi:HEAT repeat domain-containing protein [Lentisalinibacter sediminis]|uniref:HEAT repeat domain-containing protein n=1 Tax=Lentisalinibacter sediminis TaxID=2992237 RepID=UPI00386C1C3E
MLAWLFDSAYDTEVRAALWSTVVAGIATVVLFVYTLGLRFATVTGARRRRRLVSRWRGIFANAILSRRNAENEALPRVRHYQRTDLLEEWNRARDTVEGSAADNLIILADRLGFARIARELLRSRRLSGRLLGVQTLGHLRDADSWGAIAALVASPNTALSVTAAVALAEIDPARAVELLVPMIPQRRDWPRTRVSRILRKAGSELVSEPLYRAIRSGDDDEKIYLLQFGPLAEAETVDALCDEIIRSTNHPGVLTAALKQVSGHAGVPRLPSLTRHDAWYVRMQVAKVLGRVGQMEHVSLLASLLDDPEWWVRYRAAQALVRLPFLGPNALRDLRERQSDRYARDMLEQAMAERGLA